MFNDINTNRPTNTLWVRKVRRGVFAITSSNTDYFEIFRYRTSGGSVAKFTIEPNNSTSSRTTVSKNLGGGLGKIWGPVPHGPNVEPPLYRTLWEMRRNITLYSDAVNVWREECNL